ncbi:phosphoribosyl-ATP pyrophosphohydrolase [Aequitasia blattaphilus]|uniref:Histidine biosynthesis bifunctional protein HisIE n=1 Tax=Aequitasia blattaphilus TaxID=2949332 RepID=A0ABT1E5I4_9FIRM|nr:bifunctional phosphoribosyl-AMP cyclohydrolase/phosphoribosyl-ATP diphosphatase HisIE [Aequitasia blattaphilus]MCP1101084.1 bifunctional phosphoribosyl-AMP cyclohydrolase/phosphoribosyl-ATP diphosphatase HisIE [Aequitasia blattaphilus]MCR8613724.1 bifunctional phosphoribosyl-AMP cyclohydrolase/phosphoribosyl-ATP diphosphatase HisIE [Aequitasia blattaphilus]
MSLKRIIPCIFLKHKKAVNWFDDDTIISGNVLELVRSYNEKGADELLIFDLSRHEEDKDEVLHFIKRIKKATRIPLLIAGNINNLEDVKKVLYAGASKVVINISKPDADQLIEAAAARFGKEKISVSINDFDALFKHQHTINKNARELLIMHQLDMDSVKNVSQLSSVVFSQSTDKEEILSLLEKTKVRGVTGPFVSREEMDFFALKEECVEKGIPVSTFESEIEFSEMKLNDQGLIPVIVQNYKTEEVLMMAYMNEEAFNYTIKTGKMTYYSRSRKQLWIKGETSGHTQYLKSIQVDCDKDTLLAKVEQLGAACHTGNPTCFYTPVAGEINDMSNPLNVFKDLYDTIVDRRENPKEGSYTNYLFDKGIDKILKKVGEEAAEIIIASKNPNTEEIKYEIADFLYHMNVLMVEKGITWEEILEELDDR